MKRRTFILAALGVTGIITIPVLNYKCRSALPDDPWVRPDVLSGFCDADTIREIGIHYRLQVPHEDNKQRLMELLLTNDAGKKLTSHRISKVSDWLDKRIREEFNTGRMVNVAGWILSLTETRQCALFSFESN